MILSLLENGVDSLEYGVNFYCKFLDLEDKYSEGNPTHLKMSVIMIHNACELFIKSYLNSINELLIYNLNDKNRKDVLLSCYSKSINNPDYDLESCLINENCSVKTHDYNELVDIFKTIYQLDNKYYWSIKKIGEYRNMVTHYGINLKNDYYSVLQAINGTLDLIFEELPRSLKSMKNKKFISLSNTYDDIFIHAEETLKNEWASTHKDNFEKINIYIEQALSSIEFDNFLKVNGVKVRWRKSDNRAEPYNELNISCKDIHEVLYSINVPFLDVTFFADDLEQDGPIYFILDHSCTNPEKSLVIFKNPIQYRNFEYAEIKFWTDNEFKNNRENRKFNLDNFEYALQNIVKCIIKEQ